MATEGRVRCEYFYDTNDEYVSGVWAQSIACSVLSSQQFGERYLEELCNQKYQRKIFLCKNYWVQYWQHTKDCFKEILGLPYLLCIFFTNNVINNNFQNILDRDLFKYNIIGNRGNILPPLVANNSSR